MSNLTIVIPSKSASNLVQCIAAVRKHEPDARIIVIDDDTGSDVYTVCMETACEQLRGFKPFIFSRAVNQGIRAAGDSDCVILNDDAILETPGGFSIMASAAADNPEVGIVGAVTDLTGQPLQCRQRNVQIEDAAREMPAYGLRAVEHIAFVCVLIPARTREALRALSWRDDHVFSDGFLDERYTAYGSDDLDYCMQVRQAGLLVTVHDGCYINHGSLKSSYRGDPRSPGDIWKNHRLLRAKWGLSPAINPADPMARGAR